MTDKERNKEVRDEFAERRKCFAGFLCENVLDLSTQQTIIDQYNLAVHVAYSLGYKHGITQGIEELKQLQNNVMEIARGYI